MADGYIPRAAVGWLLGWSWVMVVTAVQSNCIVDEIAVMPDFNMTQMYGKWYEVYWIPPYMDKPEDFWDNFVEDWSAGDTEDVVDVKAVGRAINATECGSFTKTYNKKSDEEEAAKWFIKKSKFQLDAWIISTNYDTYSLIYGCTMVGDNGTCDSHHGWVWSRTDTLRDEDKTEIQSKLPALCLEWEDWEFTPQDKPCNDIDSQEDPTEDTSSAHVHHPTVILLTLTAVMCHTQTAYFYIHSIVYN